MKINIKSKLTITIQILLLICLTNVYGQPNFWEPIDGLYGGRVSAIAINSNNHIFAGVSGSWTTYSGVYRSTNNAESWNLTNNNLFFFMRVKSLAINSVGHIFVAIDNNGEGVFRSTDDGVTWEQINNGLTSPIVRSIVIKSNGDIFAGTQGGIFRTTDNGDSWIEINNGLTILNVFTIAINSNGQIFAGTISGGMFRSTNNGDDWAAINSGLGQVNITVCAINLQNNIFVGTLDGQLYRSDDNGDNWTQLTNDSPNSTINALAIGKNDYVFAATGSEGVFRSTDNGDNWAAINSELPYRGIVSLGVDSSGQIFAGTFGGGIFCSTNDGNSWFHASRGLVPIGIEDIQLDSLGDIFIVGAGGEVIFRSVDEGQNWKLIGVFDPTGGALRMNRTGTLFYPSEQKLFRSLDYGDNWSIIDTSGWRHILTVGENNDVIAKADYVGDYDYIELSTDNGDNWKDILQIPAGTEVIALITADSTIFITLGLRVYKSTDNGISWTFSNLPTIYGPITELINDTHDNLFVGTSASSTLGGGIFKSIDNGATWEFIIGSPPVSSIKINKNNQMVATGIDNVNPDIIISGDNGESWQQINEDLPSRSYGCGSVIDSIGRILVGTDIGLFRSVDPLVDIKQSTKHLSSLMVLEQNFPNPFNSFTTFSFSLQSKTFVSLKVFDLLGREVAQIISETMSAGNHHMQWDSKELSSGVYFYQLQAGPYNEVRKLILLR